MKTIGERRTEATTWGVLFMWLGSMMLFDEPAGLTGVGAGGILLLSALIQKAAGWEAGAVLWIAGIALLLSGINELLGDRDIPAAAVALIIVGGLIIAKSVAGGSRARGRRGKRPGTDVIDV